MTPECENLSIKSLKKRMGIDIKDSYMNTKSRSSDNLQTFIIDGEAVGKGSPRFTRRVHTYTPKKTADYEKHIKRQLTEQGAEPFEKETPLRVEVTFYKGHLKSWTKKQVFQAE